MKLHARDKDAQKYNVFLNGVQLHDCLVADSDAGLVKRTKTRLVGNPPRPEYLRNGAGLIMTYTEYGEVVIKPKEQVVL